MDRGSYYRGTQGHTQPCCLYSNTWKEREGLRTAACYHLGPRSPEEGESEGEDSFKGDLTAEQKQLKCGQTLGEILECTFRGAAESKYIMELRTCTVRKRTKKYIPASRTSFRATSASRANHPPCRGPKTFWQGQTCSWLTEGEKEEDRSHPAGLQSGLSSTLVAPSLSGILACLCTRMCIHPHPPPLLMAQGLVWSPPPEALESSLSQRADLISAPLGNGVSTHAKGKQIKATSQVTGTYMLVTAAQLPARAGHQHRAPQPPGGARRSRAPTEAGGVVPHGVWDRGCTPHTTHVHQVTVCPPPRDLLGPNH